MLNFCINYDKENSALKDKQNLIKKKLGKKYSNLFQNLKKNLSNQEGFANLIQDCLSDIGLFENSSDKDKKESLENEENTENNEDKSQESKQNEQNNNDHSRTEDTSNESLQSVDPDGEKQLGDDSAENEIEYFPKIESNSKIENTLLSFNFLKLNLPNRNRNNKNV